MGELISWLEEYGYNLISSLFDDDGHLTHLYFDRLSIIYCVIAPHSGNGYKYILRANSKITFDKWSNCEAEYKFDTIEEIEDLLENNQPIYDDILKTVFDNNDYEDPIVPVCSIDKQDCPEPWGKHIMNEEVVVSKDYCGHCPIYCGDADHTVIRH
jgi:hypothetical protein